MRGTHEVTFLVESDQTLTCKGVWIERFIQPTGGGYFREATREHAEAFDAKGSGVPELEDWARKNCEDC